MTTLSQLVCPSTTTCVAIGTNGAAPVIFTFTVSASSSDTWHLDTVPSGGGTVTNLTQATCPSATSCLVVAAGTVAGTPAGFLLSTSNLGGTTTT